MTLEGRLLLLLLDTQATKRLIEQYSVVVSRHFMIRVNALIAYIKNNRVVIGGQVKDYWWRIEFQNHGINPLVHMLA